MPQPDSLTSAIEHALAEHSSREGGNNATDLESMLARQAELLHRIFMHSTQKYAATATDEHGRIHSTIALKSQNYCRMTVTALTSLKTRKAVSATEEKPWNELLRGQSIHAPLDTRRTPAPTGADPWLAAMEQQLWQQDP